MKTPFFLINFIWNSRLGFVDMSILCTILSMSFCQQILPIGSGRPETRAPAPPVLCVMAPLVREQGQVRWFLPGR